MAEAYLVRKEKETGMTVPHDQRQQELQKVKMFIADRNVYGIDLNPVAVELAEVSLWLNTIYQGAYVPWFRTQIVNGNSLIGARRQCYTLNQLQAGKGSAVWYVNAPERIEPGQKRKFAKQVYHFLAGDPGMCSYTDKVIKSLEPDKIAFIKDWNKKFCKPFTEDECDRVLELSAQIDKLWDAHVELRREISEKTTDPLSVWGQPEDKVHTPMTIREKDAIYEGLYLSHGAENASPYARLKAVMDYWCALWFWPIDKAEELPTRQEFLFDVQMMLGLDVVRVSGDKKNKGQMSVFDFMPDQDPYVQEMIERYDRFGAVNLDRLRADFPRLRIANEVAQQQHFFHWELEFADVFVERGGFDLIVGNPPWIKMEWNEKAVMGDRYPLLAVRNFSANQTAKARSEILSDRSVRALYFDEYISISGEQSFLNAVQNYPDLVGMKANLYKCFLPLAWYNASISGVSAFIHQDGVYDDPKGALLRLKLYPRLRKHFQFENELGLFEGTNDHGKMKFSLNIYGGVRKNIAFDMICNLYAPKTIDECYSAAQTDEVPGIKDKDGNWNTKGHPKRIVPIHQKEMKTLAKLFDENGDWRTAKLPLLHAAQFLDTLSCFLEHEHTLGSLNESEVYTTQFWNETTSQDDGTMEALIRFPEYGRDVIYSSAHIGVANPLFQVTRREYYSNNDYDRVDLTTIPNDFLIRTRYQPACSRRVYDERSPITPWGRLTDQYHIMMRRRVGSGSERTLTCAIAACGFAHVHAVISIALNNCVDMVNLAGAQASVPYDFLIKCIGKSDIYFSTLSCFPIFSGKEYSALTLRTLLLNCLTNHYADLWKQCWNDEYRTECWSKKDPRLDNNRFQQVNEMWSGSTPLRTEYERRQALVEIDVLTAMALGMTLDQLKTIYVLQFPLLKKSEDNTWYDANGRVVFSTSGNMLGVGVDRKRWETEMKGAPAGSKFYQTITDDTMPGGPVERTIEYVAPFDRCDREQDYETAWVFFSKRKG